MLLGRFSSGIAETDAAFRDGAALSSDSRIKSSHSARPLVYYLVVATTLATGTDAGLRETAFLNLLVM